MATLNERAALRFNPHLRDRISTALVVAAEAVRNELADFTATDTGDVFTSTAHGFSNGNKVELFDTGSGLPTGVVVNRTYFIVGATANTFQLADTSGGSAIALTADGNGGVAVQHHTARFTWAAGPMLAESGADSEARRAIRLVLENSTIQNQYNSNPTTGGTATDNDVQFVVNGLVNTLAGAELI